MDPETDGILYDFGNKQLKFGKYRLFTFLSVYSIDKSYLYRLITKSWFLQRDILGEFLECLEYKENEKDEWEYNNISSNDDNDSDDENDENEN